MTGDRSGELPTALTQRRALQVARIESSAAAPPEDSSAPSEGGVGQVLTILDRYKIVIALGVVIGLGLGILQLVLDMKMYKSRTTIEIQGVNESFMNMDQVDPQAGSDNFSASQPNIHTQLQILNSHMLKSKVLERLEQNLPTIKPRDPDWQGRIRLALGLETDNAAEIAKQAVRIAVGTSMPASVKGTRVIEITNSSPVPEVGAEVLNALAQEYIEYRLEERFQNSQRTNRWLTERIEDAKAKLHDAESRLETQRRLFGIAAAGVDSLAGQRLQELERSSSAATAERISKEAQYAMIATAPEGKLPDLLEDPQLKTYQAELTSMRRQRSDLLVNVTPAHTSVKKLDNQIAELQTVIKTHSEEVLKRLKSDLDSSAAREKLLSSTYSRQSSISAARSKSPTEVQALQREVDVNRQSYNLLLQQINQSQLASALPSNNVRVIDAALPARKHYRPDVKNQIIMGLIFGLGLGCGFAFLRERFRPRLRTPGLSQSLLRLPELGVIPAVDGNENRDWKLLPFRNDGSPSLGLTLNRPLLTPDSMAWTDRPSILAESFRFVLTSLLIESGMTGGHRAFVVGSPSSGEGKTTVSSNVAIALAETGDRVLVIDADLRNPRLHNLFRLDNSFGLSNILNDSAPVESYPLTGFAKPSHVPNLDVLPAGSAVTNIGNLIYSPRMKNLLTRLRKEYSAIIIDTPPILDFPECRVLGRLCEGVILVLRSGVTSPADAMSARNRLLEDGSQIVGTILNDWRPGRTELKRYRQYGYYSQKA